jgi:hypothetical protein
MRNILFAVAVVVLAGFVSCTHVEMDLDVPAGGVLHDAILITSPAGDIPREASALGDVDLTETNLSFAYDLDAANSTHWWLIGHNGSGKVVYTSTENLDNVGLYDVEPYDIANATTWNIPANLDAWVNGRTYSLDWWAQTVNNHSSHVAADEDSATLWRFDATGTAIGTITMSLHVPD